MKEGLRSQKWEVRHQQAPQPGLWDWPREVAGGAGHGGDTLQPSRNTVRDVEMPGPLPPFPSLCLARCGGQGARKQPLEGSPSAGLSLSQGMARTAPRAKRPWWHVSGITYLNFLIFVLQILSPEFLNEVPTAAELVNICVYTHMHHVYSTQDMHAQKYVLAHEHTCAYGTCINGHRCTYMHSALTCIMQCMHTQYTHMCVHTCTQRTHTEYTYIQVHTCNSAQTCTSEFPHVCTKTWCPCTCTCVHIMHTRTHTNA